MKKQKINSKKDESRKKRRQNAQKEKKNQDLNSSLNRTYTA